MNLDKTGYLPINQVNTDLRKNVTKPITSFRGTESEPVKDDESQKVSAEQVKAYYGITAPEHINSKNKSQTISDNTAEKELTQITYKDIDGKLKPRFNSDEIKKLIAKGYDIEKIKKVCEFTTEPISIRSNQSEITAVQKLDVDKICEIM